MAQPDFSRREALKTGSAVVAAVMAQMATPGFVFSAQEANEELVPFLNMPRSRPNMLDWESLDSWITPQDQVFNVAHYNQPQLDGKEYSLEIAGLVDKPQTLSLDAIKALPKQDRLMTLECSGNGVNKGFMAAIYNSKWTGTPLATLLTSCGLKPEAKEIVFFGHDQKEETIRDVKVEVPFGRSMSVEDALSPNNLLAYDRNGKPLEPRNGFPLRLIAPGCYGIANVKWIRRIEVRNRRYMGRFMGRDYVTLRGEKQGDKVVYVESSVYKMNLKSMIARVTQGKTKDGAVPTKAYGAVWHNDAEKIAKVEVRVDDGPWKEATLDKEPRSKYCWTFFSIDLGSHKPGKHTVVSRAIDTAGHIQPSAEDDEIALKKTYWEAYQQWPREIELKG